MLALSCFPRDHVLHPDGFLFLPIRTNSEASWMMLCTGGHQCVWSLPAVLCQRAINRSEGHPPSPPARNTPTKLWPTRNCPHMGAPQPACPGSRQRAVSRDAALSRENPCTRSLRLLSSRPHGWEHPLRFRRIGIIQNNGVDDIFRSISIRVSEKWLLW